MEYLNYATLFGGIMDMYDNRQKTKEKVDEYYNLYFSLKKRKDLRRKAKSRLMKNAEKEWQFWKTMEIWEKDIFGSI